jgi:hypothetical protein
MPAPETDIKPHCMTVYSPARFAREPYRQRISNRGGKFRRLPAPQTGHFYPESPIEP